MANHEIHSVEMANHEIHSVDVANHEIHSVEMAECRSEMEAAVQGQTGAG
jgi:hypothetical protein